MPGLAWLPDETLFSRCSRIHRWHGCPDAAQTSQALFGHPRTGVHDFPGFIDRWIEACEPARNSRPQDVLFGHTVLGFYRPFLKPERAAAAVAQLRSSSMGSLKFQLGILTSRFGADHPLKACVACMREDQAAFQTAYWHQQHQWPGVWWCHKHGELLKISHQRSAAGERFAWCLPSAPHLHDLVPTQMGTVRSASLDSTLSHLAAMVCGVASLPEEAYLDPEILGRCYRGRLQALSLLSTGHRLKYGDIGERLAAVFAPLASVPELDCLAGVPMDVAKQAAGVLLRPSRRCHPLRHIALMHALFDDWESFWTTYEMLAANTRPPGAAQQMKRPQSDQEHGHVDIVRARFLQALAQGQSISAAAAAAGVDTTTGLAWATQVGIQVKRRPKRLKPDVREPMVRQLRRGMDKTVVASHAGVSVETITRVLRTEVGLSQAWNAARQGHAQADARMKWSRSLRKHEGEGFIQVRRHAAAAYTWLYRHDREWLHEHLPSAERRIKPRKGPVNWDVRDRKLASTICYLHEQGVLKSPRLWEIYLKVPDLKAKLNQIAELPQTRAAVEALIGRPWMRR